MSRLSLSTADKQARDWFVKTARSLQCKTHFDKMGNIFAIRPGRREGAPTVSGSHLDTQPTGGRYDGILGITAGLEALRVIVENDIQTEFPIGVVNWTNEEGARFPISMVASGVWAGEVSLEDAHSLKEVGAATATMKQELENIGYLGELDANHAAMPLGGHFELHIEQGPILEASKRKIGVVEGVQAYRWHTVTIRGRDAHTGTTDLKNRSDALLTAAKMILHSHNLANQHNCLASTGIMNVAPGSTNTIPGLVHLSLDIRSQEDARLMAFEKALRADFDAIACGDDVAGLNSGGVKGRGCSVHWRLDSDSPAVRFDEDCIGCVAASASDLLGDDAGKLTQRMVSGAGHDRYLTLFSTTDGQSLVLITSSEGETDAPASVHTSKRCPTSMIFVPCKDGVSHNPAEYCAPSDCANGAQVLLWAMLRFDRLRSARE